jgi:hypothetical protein
MPVALAPSLWWVGQLTSVVASDAGGFQSDVSPLSPICPAAEDLLTCQPSEFTLPNHFIDATNSTDDAGRLTNPVCTRILP